MEPTNISRAPLLPQVVLYVLILASAAYIVFPGVQRLPWAKYVVELMLFALAIPMFYREFKNKNTLQTIYAQAKAGRKLTSRLELAAMIAVGIAVWIAG